MAVQAGFRRFRFFASEAREGPVAPAHVTCSAAGADGSLWLGCADGTVLGLAGSDLSTEASFQAHQGCVRAIEWSKGKLLTVGEDGEGLRNLQLKAWAVEGLRPGAAPSPLAPPCRLLPAAPKVAPSAAGASEGVLAAVALRCTDWPSVAGGGWAVQWHGAHPASRRCQGKGHRTRAGRTAAGRGGQPLGAALCGVGGGRSRTGERRSGHSRRGPPSCTSLRWGRLAWRPLMCAPGTGCWRMSAAAARGQRSEARGELMVAAPEAVFFYTAEEGRKAAYSVRGEKLALAAARHYAVVVLAEEGAPGGGAASQALVQVYDLQNKVVAASAPLEQPLAWLLPHAGGACIDVGDAAGGVVRLTEKPLAEKLEALYRSRSYQLAVAVAEAEQADAATLAGIRRQYGDFLYSKRDYDQAMEQYAATVGHLEPSYVIQRYLDVQRIHSLTDYLERLHSEGHASCDHTTLLLNCYTKLKDVAKLDAFIQGDGQMSRDALHFDIDTAIRVCRSAGYHEHALYVALAAGERASYLDILLEDCHRYSEGLQYIRGLPRQEAAAALQKYGKALLGALPVETTALLMGLCLRDPTDPAAWVASLGDFAHLYTDRPEDLQYACVTILNMNPDSPSRQTLYHTLLDLYLSPAGSAAGGTAPAAE
ncbi:hypothetical protein ABPG77_004353, partial [Micractinium sp. CCAP 211/92]